MRALIADDDRIGVMMLTQALKGWNLEVITAADGSEAWSRLLDGPGVAMAILDWMMPGLDGPALCKLIRGHASLAQMYVILLTGRNGQGDVVAGLDAGA